METMQQSQAKAQRRDFAKPVAGVQVGDSHYSIRKVGYYFGKAKIVTEVQLVVDGEIKARGRQDILSCLASCAAQPHFDVDDARYLLRALDSIQTVTYFDDDFSVLQGQTLVSVEGATAGSEQITFTLADGRRFQLYHEQDCCETVNLEDVCGDITDLIGAPLALAECREGHSAKHYEECPEWTFYKLVTNKGAVTLRWYGDSNGYYSTAVTFAELKGAR